MSKRSEQRPMEYWAELARMGFEDDLHRLVGELGLTQADLAKALGKSEAYISQVMNGRGSGNFTIETLVKFGLALDAVVQIRLARDGREVVRVMDFETARRLDLLLDESDIEGEASQLEGGSRRPNLLKFTTEVEQGGEERRPEAHHYDPVSDSLDVKFEPPRSAWTIELTENIRVSIDRQARRAVALGFLDVTELARPTPAGPRSFPVTGLTPLPADDRELVLKVLGTDPVRHWLDVSVLQSPAGSPLPIVHLRTLPEEILALLAIPA